MATTVRRGGIAGRARPGSATTQVRQSRERGRERTIQRGIRRHGALRWRLQRRQLFPARL